MPFQRRYNRRFKRRRHLLEGHENQCKQHWFQKGKSRKRPLMMQAIQNQQRKGKEVLRQICLHHTFGLQFLQPWKNMVISQVRSTSWKHFIESQEKLVVHMKSWVEGLYMFTLRRQLKPHVKVVVEKGIASIATWKTLFNSWNKTKIKRWVYYLVEKHVCY